MKRINGLLTQMPVDTESHCQAENVTRYTMLLLAMFLTRCGIWAQTLSLSRPRLKALFVTRKNQIIRHNLLDMSILVPHGPAEATFPQHPTTAPSHSLFHFLSLPARNLSILTEHNSQSTERILEGRISFYLTLS